jgi:capsular exopolysaccharide synthesis family protein
MSEIYPELQRPSLPPSGDTGSAREEGVTAREIVAAIRRRWWLVAAVALLVFAIGTWRTMQQPRIFRATATVRFQPQQAPIQGISTPSGRADYRIDPMQSEQELIKSQNVSERVVQKLGLRLQPAPSSRLRRSDVFAVHPAVDSTARTGSYELLLDNTGYSLRFRGGILGRAAYGDSLFAPGIRLFLAERPAGVPKVVPLSLVSSVSATESIRGGIATRVRPQTDIIEISYQGTDPSLVRDIANGIAEGYAEFSSESQRATARAKSQFIEGQLAEQERRLGERQDALKNFKELHQTTDVTSEQTALFEQLQKYEADRRTALTERSVYQALTGKLAEADTIDEELRRLVGTEAVTRNQLVADLYQQWFKLLDQRDELLTVGGRTPIHPDVRALDTRIARTKSQLRDASRLYLEGLNSRLASLSKTLADMRKQSERYPPMEAQQAKLSADVRTYQKMYDDLQSQFQLARIAESVEGGSVRPIDWASTPEFAVLPLRRRAMILSAVIGLMLGVGLAVGLDRLDTSVRSAEELSERLDVSVLGMIPVIRVNRRDASLDGDLGRLVSHVDPRSPVAEAYRSLRTNLAFARAAQRLHTIVLTSPGPADGKSTTTANLAVTFAQQGQRTLVVDTDLRRSVLDKTFGVARAPGLTDVILGTTSLAEAVKASHIPNLSVLPSGQHPPNPSELLGSTAMQGVLTEVKELFDVVLFDSPPLLAVTDAAILSTMVDGTLLVVRMGATAREAVRRAVNQLRAVRGRLLGAVLNDVDFRKGSAYSEYGYYYYSYYGHENGNGRHAGLLGRLRDLSRLRGLVGRREDS